MVLDAQCPKRGGELALAPRGIRRGARLDVRDARHQLAPLTARGGHHVDLVPGRDEFGDQGAGRQGLVVGMCMSENDDRRVSQERPRVR